MSTTLTLAALLAELPLLAPLPEAERTRLVDQVELRRLPQGQTLLRNQQCPEEVYWLVEGVARSLVNSPRLRQGVATLEKQEPGALLGLSALTSGVCRDTVLASTPLVVLAVPVVVLKGLMERLPDWAERIRHTVSAAELFGVLDHALKDLPMALEGRLLEAARQLAPHTVVLQQPVGEAVPLAEERLWLVAGGPAPEGSRMRELPAGEPGEAVPWRLLGVPMAPWEALLSAPGPEQASTEASRLLPMLRAWQQQRPAQLDQIPLQSLPLALPQLTRAEERERPAAAYPWFRGVGPLDSPVAAFRMLSEELQLPFRRDLLRRVLGEQVGRHGVVSLALAGALAESIGLHTQLLQVGVEGLLPLQTPLLIRWGDGLAVLWRLERERVVVGIPAIANQELSLEAFEEQWGSSGEVLSLRVGAFTPQRHFGFRWFLPALREHRTVLIEVLLASFFVQLFGLVNPLLIQQVIDKVIINHSPSALGVLGFLLVIFALFEGLLLCLRTFLFVDTTNRIDQALGSQIIDHLLRLPLGYFDRRSVGEVSSRISELEKVRSFLTGTALTTILDAIFAVLYVVVMLLYSWQLTLLTLAVIPPLLVLTLSVSPLIREQLQRRAIANARTQSHLVEVLSSMLTVKAQNMELRSRWRWQDLYGDYVAEGFDNTLLSTTASSISSFLNKLSGLIVIWAGASLVLQGSLSLGGLIAFRIIAGYVTGPLLRMTSIWQSLQETALSLERLSDVIDHPQEAPADNAQRLVMPPIEGEIRFEGIDFRYRTSSPLLLSQLHLSIPAGSFVAIVGASGSGKSTLAKLLARLYTPERGRILIDGLDISKVELYSLRRQLGVVPQETVLFDGTIEANITLTNSDADHQEVIEAARMAGAHEFIMDLPASYATEVGERGASLSGGQRQRIAIARTVLQKPRLLILDEATSALDYQTERLVSENLMRGLRGCTVLFITHRLSSIVEADRIVCMGGGAVLEVGRHAELMAARGAYYALYRQQGRDSAAAPAPLAAPPAPLAAVATPAR